jgi:hypothetical protein
LIHLKLLQVDGPQETAFLISWMLMEAFIQHAEIDDALRLV